MDPQTDAAATNPPPVDSPGAANPLPDAQLAQTVQRAADAAVEQHVAESKKYRGQRGPDKKPRRPRVPVEQMGNGAASPPLADGETPSFAAWIEPEPPFDEKTAAALVDLALGLLNDGAYAIIHAVAKKETGDAALAVEAATSVRMTEKIATSVRTGAIECAKKYAIRMDYAPELMLGGGLVIWAGQVLTVKRALQVKGQELRGEGTVAAG